jgi:hypothetical protein
MLLHQKEKIEHYNKDEIDKSDKELTDKIKKINYKAQQMMLYNFKSNPQSETKMEAVKDIKQSFSNRQEHKERKTLAK